MKILVALALLIPLWACERDGPLERAGEEVDEAVQDLGNGGERRGNQIDDAVDDIRDGIDDARDELRD